MTAALLVAAVLAQGLREWKLEVSPGLPVVTVRKVLAEKLRPQLCVPQILPRAAPEVMDDRVLVTFDISSDGKVEAPGVRGIADEGCLRSQVMALLFPSPMAGQRVSVEAGYLVVLDTKASDAAVERARRELDELCTLAAAAKKGFDEKNPPDVHGRYNLRTHSGELASTIAAKAFLAKRGFRLTEREPLGDVSRVTQHVFRLLTVLLGPEPGPQCPSLISSSRAIGAPVCPVLLEHFTGFLACPGDLDIKMGH